MSRRFLVIPSAPSEHSRSDFARAVHLAGAQARHGHRPARSHVTGRPSRAVAGLGDDIQTMNSETHAQVKALMDEVLAGLRDALSTGLTHSNGGYLAGKQLMISMIPLIGPLIAQLTQVNKDGRIGVSNGLLAVGKLIDRIAGQPYQDVLLGKLELKRWVASANEIGDGLASIARQIDDEDLVTLTMDRMNRFNSKAEAILAWLEEQGGKVAANLTWLLPVIGLAALVAGAIFLPKVLGGGNTVNVRTGSLEAFARAAERNGVPMGPDDWREPKAPPKKRKRKRKALTGKSRVAIAEEYEPFGPTEDAEFEEIP